MGSYVVPFINYSRMHNLHGIEYLNAIRRCLFDGDLIYRSDLIKFESTFSSFCDCKYGIGTGSCSNALYIALKALGIGPGDEVITVAHTFVATVDAIVSCGAVPVLVDINEHDMLMNMDEVEKAITPRTKAIIPVHLNGRMCDMDRLAEIVKDKHIHIIEDAAQAPGATFNDKKAGSFGDCGCFSFYPAKVLGSFGDGGMITTNDSALYKKLMLLRSHGEYPPYVQSDSNKPIYRWGFHTRLDNVAAAYLNVKMEYLGQNIRRRYHIAGIYRLRLMLPEIINPPGRRSNGLECEGEVWQNYVIRLDSMGTRDALKSHLERNGVETMISWPVPIHEQPALNLDISLPVTERVSKTCLSLPLYPELTAEEVEYVIKATKSYFK